MLRRALALGLLAVPSCSTEPGDVEPSCVTVETNCAPLYAPNFDAVYARTLLPSCATDEGACHTASANSGGLAFVDPDQSHAALLDASVAPLRVRPFDAACSRLTVMLHGADRPWAMPPGRALDDAERCAIERWIAQGARR